MFDSACCFRMCVSSWFCNCCHPFFASYLVVLFSKNKKNYLTTFFINDSCSVNLLFSLWRGVDFRNVSMFFVVNLPYVSVHGLPHETHLHFSNYDVQTSQGASMARVQTPQRKNMQCGILNEQVRHFVRVRTHVFRPLRIDCR